MPDPLVGSNGTPAPAQTPPLGSPPPSAISAPPPSGGTPPANGGSITPPPGSGAPGSITPPPTESYTDLLDVVKQYRPDLAGRFQDSNQALQYLLQASQQADRWRQFEPHIGQFQQWQAQREQQAREERAKQNAWWNPPEWDASWERGLEVLPNGQIQVRPGFPPDLAQKYLAARSHQRDFLDKFSFDPIGSIKPGIEQMVKEIAGQLMQQNLGGYAEQNAASDFVRQNREWLYDASGRGLSQHGQLFAQAVQEAEQLGIRNVEGQQRYAMRAVQHNFAVSEWQRLTAAQPGTPTPPASPNDAAKNAFLQSRAGAQAPPANGAGHNPGTPPPRQPIPSGASHQNRLTRMLMDNARKEGMNVGDAVLPG